MTDTTATVKTLTISRAIWLRGEGSNDSYLLRETDQKMCCVGIYLYACGVPKDWLTGRQTPHDSGCDRLPLPEQARWLESTSDDGVGDLFEINDAHANDPRHASFDIPDEGTREAMIAEQFVLHGITVVFVD